MAMEPFCVNAHLCLYPSSNLPPTKPTPGTYPGKDCLLILVDAALRLGNEVLVEAVSADDGHPGDCLAKVRVYRRLGGGLQSLQLPRARHVHPANRRRLLAGN